MKWLGKGRFRFLRGQRGISLIETLVALALLGIIAVVFLGGLSTAHKSLAISQERVIAESLAKSQVEYIKEQQYISVVNYDPDTNCYEKIDIPANLVGAGYTIEIVPPELVTPAGTGGYELQSLTIKVRRDETGKLTMTFYRAGLAL